MEGSSVRVDGYRRSFELATRKLEQARNTAQRLDILTELTLGDDLRVVPLTATNITEDRLRMIRDAVAELLELTRY